MSHRIYPCPCGDAHRNIQPHASMASFAHGRSEIIGSNWIGHNRACIKQIYSFTYLLNLFQKLKSKHVLHRFTTFAGWFMMILQIKNPWCAAPRHPWSNDPRWKGEDWAGFVGAPLKFLFGTHRFWTAHNHQPCYHQIMSSWSTWWLESTGI